MIADDTATTDWLEAAERLLPGGLLGRAGLPRELRYVAAKATGARVVDLEGRAYVDYLAGAGALILGHSHPAVTRAIQAQVEIGTQFFSIPSPVVIRFAEALVEAVPSAEKVTLATTGSEATQYALRLARAWTGRDRIVKFEGGYHGNHDAVQMNTTSRVDANDAVGQSDSLGVARAVGETVLVAPYNDLAAVERILREHKNEIAAIIIDPAQRGGVFAEPEFLAGLRRAADAHGALLVFDEVITGFRLAYGGAQAVHGVRPDLTALGKVAGGGLPVGAVAGPAEIIDLADWTREGAGGRVLINGTHHGLTLAAAAGLATLAELRRPGFYDRLNAWAELLRQEIDERLRRHAVPAVVYGQGSFWYLAFAPAPPRDNADVLAANGARLAAFDAELIRHGISLLPGGRRLTTAAHGEAELADTLEAVDAACRRDRAAN